MEQTLALIKPDAVERNIIGKILAMIENDNFDKSFNSVHGSDSIENAKLEISIIFGD